MTTSSDQWCSLKVGYWENRCFPLSSASEKNNVLKALRIWVKRKRGRDKQYIDVQTLNYYDLLPESLNEYGKFENLDHLLARANEMIANREVQGNLITVESLICESSGAAWKVSRPWETTSCRLSSTG